MTDNAAGPPAGPVATAPAEPTAPETDSADSVLAVVGLIIGVGIALMGIDLLSGGKVWAVISRRQAAADPAASDG